MALAVDPRPLPGEPLALDLLNTVLVSDGAIVDTFERPRGVERWLAASGLPDHAGDAVREALVEAREAIRGVLASGAAAERRRFDRVLDRGRVRVSMDERGAIRREVEVRSPSWRPAVLAAVNLIELLETAPDRIKSCAHPNCVLWFLDTTRNGTRRWCSMAGCGNRAKAQRHYKRSRLVTQRTDRPL
jgi:predicted RNA-binding Zn ribbon-like protein